MRKFGQPHRSQGVCREIECANPAARLRLEFPTRALRGGQLSLLLARSDRLEPWGANPRVPPLDPRFLSSPTEFGWSRCRDDQPLSFSASSVWGVSTRFRLQIGMIPRCEHSFGTPQLAPFSTRLPPELLDRLRVAARQLGLCQGEIVAAALDLLLTDEGF